MHFFNTTGPVRSDKHYCIPPLSRLDLGEVLTLIRDERYFVLHAPRQTGKTSALLALRDLLNGGAEGDYRCVYANIEAAQAVREDVERAMRVILGELSEWARTTLRDEFLDERWPDILARFGDGALGAALTRWAEADSETAGAADRRDRFPGRGYAAGGAAPTASRIRSASGVAFRRASFCAECATCATTASIRAPRRR